RAQDAARILRALRPAAHRHVALGERQEKLLGSVRGAGRAAPLPPAGPPAPHGRDAPRSVRAACKPAAAVRSAARARRKAIGALGAQTQEIIRGRDRNQFRSWTRLFFFDLADLLQ